MTDQQTPEARAGAVARDLADTGRAVTARAIREGAHGGRLGRRKGMERGDGH